MVLISLFGPVQAAIHCNMQSDLCMRCWCTDCMEAQSGFAVGEHETIHGRTKETKREVDKGSSPHGLGPL